MTADLGDELVRLEIFKHDATTIGVDPVENHLHDPRKQLIDIHRVADRQAPCDT